MRGVKTHKLDQIDIADLQVVRALGDHVTSLAAAKFLGVTQPMVVYRIQLLENYFQQPIWFRHAKVDHLTPFGKMLYKYADQILDLYNELLTHAKLMKGG